MIKYWVLDGGAGVGGLGGGLIFRTLWYYLTQTVITKDRSLKSTLKIKKNTKSCIFYKTYVKKNIPAFKTYTTVKKKCVFVLHSSRVNPKLILMDMQKNKEYYYHGMKKNCFCTFVRIRQNDKSKYNCNIFPQSEENLSIKNFFKRTFSKKQGKIKGKSNLDS